tara:strand:- start:88204 stop:88389 length:186 start_codon:yes stop_codon:yes gene_type:complete
MDKDNYEYMCELPQLAHELGVSKTALYKMCRELKKQDGAHIKMEKEIERKNSATKFKGMPK